MNGVAAELLDHPGVSQAVDQSARAGRQPAAGCRSRSAADAPAGSPRRSLGPAWRPLRDPDHGPDRGARAQYPVQDRVRRPLPRQSSRRWSCPRYGNRGPGPGLPGRRPAAQPSRRPGPGLPYWPRRRPGASGRSGMKSGRLRVCQPPRPLSLQRAADPYEPRGWLGVAGIYSAWCGLLRHITPDRANWPIWVSARAVMVRPMCEPSG